MVYKWFGQFHSGCLELDDDECEGHPNSSISDTTVASVQKLLDEDCQVTIWEIEKHVGILDLSVITILHDHLGMRKVSARWVPHQLKPAQMQARVDFANFMLNKFDTGASNLVDGILTGDETWVYFYDPETKVQSKQWVAFEEDVPLKFRREQSVGKVMAAVFFHRCRILPPVLLEEGATVTGSWYSSVCLPQVLEFLHQERPKTRDHGIFLHHDNVPAHRASVMQQFLASTELTLLPHPAYSPDLAPADFFLFPKIKKNLKGKRFDTREELEQALNVELEAVTKAELRDCFAAWFHWMKKCIDLAGDYVEKCH